MKLRLIAPCLSALAGLAALSVNGQNVLQPAAVETPNRLAMSYRMAFNVSASFTTDFGPGVAIPGPGVSGVDRNYDDGYNRVDSTGNAGGYTRYWGYDNDSQYDAANHTITMHSATGSSTANDRGGGPQVGCELTYNRELGRKGKYRWGVETALNYMNVAIHDDQAASVRGTHTGDTYQLPPIPGGGGFVIPPPAPYEGPYDSTGIGNPVIYDSPSARVTSALAGTSSGDRDFNADVFGWRVGPYVEFPVVTNLSFSLSGGFSLVGVVSDYRFNEAVNTADGLVEIIPGSGSNAGLLAGAYVGGGFHLVLEQGWTAYGGAQFQYAGNYTHREGASRARLDLGESIFVSFGATYSF
jgi:hypothetical protein